ncbi:MAG TPA: ABC transporter permease [Anaerolineae bacterium]|nr:ABC transporter permease [Anaerolineae bacterium]HQK13180.1 ABC transporter permease [Anaerolineae bacterium]
MTQTTTLPIIEIKPTRGWGSLGLRDVWEYRELLYFLLWREVKGRYRQMAFGPLWIILAPLIQMFIYSVIFGSLAKLPSEGVPYPIFTYVALLPWQFFANATRTSANSLVSQQQVIAKVYFPRLVIPLSAVLSSFVDFLASFVVLVLMMLVYRVPLTWQVLTLPAFLLLAAITALGIGLWLAGLAVKFHDVAIGLGFAIDIWKYLTPVVYSATLVPERWQALYRLNPMTTVVEGFRWALLGTGTAPDITILIPTGLVLILLISGAFYFRRTERTIVDVI